MNYHLRRANVTYYYHLSSDHLSIQRSYLLLLQDFQSAVQLTDLVILLVCWSPSDAAESGNASAAVI